MWLRNDPEHPNCRKRKRPANRVESRSLVDWPSVVHAAGSWAGWAWAFALVAGFPLVFSGELPRKCAASEACPRLLHRRRPGRTLGVRANTCWIGWVEAYSRGAVGGPPSRMPRWLVVDGAARRSWGAIHQSVVADRMHRRPASLVALSARCRFHCKMGPQERNDRNPESSRRVFNR